MNLTGCFSIGYISLLIFFLFVFTFSLLAGLSSIIVDIVSIRQGEQYAAKVLEYREVRSEDSEGNVSVDYRPKLLFETNEGTQIISEADFTVGNPQEDVEYEIYYYDKTGRILQADTSILVKLAVCLFFAFIFLVAFVGVINYAFGRRMDNYWAFVQKIGMSVLLPLIMIAFDALLVYAAFFTPQSPVIIGVILFFILILTLAIMGYMKMLLKKGLPKWKQKTATSWSADWDEDDEPDEDDEEYDWDDDDEDDDIDEDGEQVEPESGYDRGEENNYNKSY
ncbi:hypothetical protein [Dysgonomonas sp. 25]|uniref:hypothetical protein n=1 Tax=Dysgonomonas sp. 25 TaxID=2302933 RepID=UPI0013CF5670|nr:hypothetical protein [Dysgonomonas sp. 25]